MVGSVFTREGENCLGSTDFAATYSSTFLSRKKQGEKELCFGSE